MSSQALCPACSLAVLNDGTLVGREVECPRCRHHFIMPGGVVSTAPALAESAKHAMSTASTPPPLKKITGNGHASNYRLVDSLLTKAEAAFHAVLQQATASRFVLFVKVRMVDVLEINDRWSTAVKLAFNRVSQKHFDFVLGDPQTLRPVMAVELDDSTHDRRKRIARDELVNELCWSVNLPLLRVIARRSYKVTDLQAAIADLLASCRR